MWACRDMKRYLALHEGMGGPMSVITQSCRVTADGSVGPCVADFGAGNQICQ